MKLILILSTTLLSLYPLNKTNLNVINSDESRDNRDIRTGIIRHDVKIEKYKEIGQRVEFDCVGRYSISEESEDYAVGVLVSPRWVLTASHFVQDSSVWMFDGRFYKSKRVIVHPYLKQLPNSRKKQFDGWDLALVELERPVLTIKPAVRYYGHLELGQKITKIGYGNIGNGKEGQKSPEHQERLGGHNLIDSIGGNIQGIKIGKDVLLCDFDSPNTHKFNKTGSSVPLPFEIGGSKGDSGGGIFMIEEGKLMLVGIVSGALGRDVKYGSVMTIARLSSANSWIDFTIN